jgi:hypothetical protein
LSLRLEGLTIFSKSRPTANFEATLLYSTSLLILIVYFSQPIQFFHLKDNFSSGNHLSKKFRNYCSQRKK